MRRAAIIACAISALTGPALTGPAHGVEPDEVLADPALEARARDISRELRCVVCQSQSIDDSNAPLAKDMRVIVRERLTAGDSDEEVKAFLVARYGDYVLLSPPLQGNTLLLWTTPLLLLVAAGGGAFVYLRAMKRRDDESAGPDDAAAGDGSA